MKLLHREDVEEAGYDMPVTGLCANISEFDLEALKFAGEWVLADDENLVGDGQRQNYLYLVITGEVGIYKNNDQGQSQHLASLGPGEAFGEMAFLSGGVASADVQASAECILWRLDHERLLEFIAENGAAGGQLCMNLASVLSGRLLDGNRKVMDIGKQLQASLHKLQQTERAGKTQAQAMRQMQGKVKATQFAFKGGASKKPSFGVLGIAAAIVALLSTAGLVASLVMGGGGENMAGDSGLQEKVDKLEANEEFYLGLKSRLESQNESLKSEKSKLSAEREGLVTQISESMGKDAKLSELQAKLAEVEGRLATASARPVAPAGLPERPPSVTTPARPSAPPETPSADAESLAWARSNSTMVFPLAVRGKKTITLQDRKQQVKIPVPVGGILRATRFHPTASTHLIVAQPNSDKFLATAAIADTNFAEAIQPRFLAHQKKVAGAANPLMPRPKTSRPRPAAPTAARPDPASGSPTSGRRTKPSADTPESAPGVPSVTVGRPQNPQKPANVLDSVASKPATRPDPRKPAKDTTKDHGANCVCKDCRVKKIGKGGSLFPDL